MEGDRTDAALGRPMIQGTMERLRFVQDTIKNREPRGKGAWERAASTRYRSLSVNG